MPTNPPTDPKERAREVERAVAARADAGARRATAEETLAQVRERHRLELEAAERELDEATADEEHSVTLLKDLHRAPGKPADPGKPQ